MKFNNNLVNSNILDGEDMKIFSTLFNDMEHDREFYLGILKHIKSNYEENTRDDKDFEGASRRVIRYANDSIRDSKYKIDILSSSIVKTFMLRFIDYKFAVIDFIRKKYGFNPGWTQNLTRSFPDDRTVDECISFLDDIDLNQIFNRINNSLKGKTFDEYRNYSIKAWISEEIKYGISDRGLKVDLSEKRIELKNIMWKKGTLLGKYGLSICNFMCFLIKSAYAIDGVKFDSQTVDRLSNYVKSQVGMFNEEGYSVTVQIDNGYVKKIKMHKDGSISITFEDEECTKKYYHECILGEKNER